MTTIQTDANGSTRRHCEDKERAPYVPPSITIHGSAEQLTQATEEGANCDGVLFGDQPCVS